MEVSHKDTVLKLVATVFAISICTIATSYMLIEMQNSINMILFWLALALIILLGSSLIVLRFFGCDRIVKMGIVILAIAIFVVGVFYLVFKAGYFELFDDIDALRTEISKTNSVALAFIFIQFAQVCILPIPGTITTVLGLLLFNPINAIIYSLIGMISGAVVMFLFGKYAGRKAVDWALGKEDVQKYLDLAQGKDNAVLTAMFLLPVFPDDIICAIAGIVGMNGWYFFIVLSISRVLSTVVSVLFFSGNFIPVDGWWLAVWVMLIAGLIAVTILFFKNINIVEDKIVAIIDKFKKKDR